MKKKHNINLKFYVGSDIANKNNNKSLVIGEGSLLHRLWGIEDHLGCVFLRKNRTVYIVESR